jgi:hypothetical protein
VALKMVMSLILNLIWLIRSCKWRLPIPHWTFPLLLLPRRPRIHPNLSPRPARLLWCLLLLLSPVVGLVYLVPVVMGPPMFSGRLMVSCGTK